MYGTDRTSCVVRRCRFQKSFLPQKKNSIPRPIMTTSSSIFIYVLCLTSVSLVLSQNAGLYDVRIVLRDTLTLTEQETEIVLIRLENLGVREKGDLRYLNANTDLGNLLPPIQARKFATTIEQLYGIVPSCGSCGCSTTLNCQCDGGGQRPGPTGTTPIITTAATAVPTTTTTTPTTTTTTTPTTTTTSTTTTTPTTTVDTTCPDGWLIRTTNTSKSCYKICEFDAATPLSWEYHESNCQIADPRAHVVIDETKEERDYLSQLIKDNNLDDETIDPIVGKYWEDNWEPEYAGDPPFPGFPGCCLYFRGTLSTYFCVHCRAPQTSESLCEIKII